MHAVFVTGTAGSGKSMLTASLGQWYEEKGSLTITVNLDPGTLNLPYTPSVDIRDYIDLRTVMDTYQLGPNGALIFASDFIATRIGEVQDEIDSLKPDMTIVDTPGQVELFAYRSSGPFFVENLKAEEKAVLFLFDSTLVSSATNLVSVSLLAASIQLRLKAPQVSVLSKKDLIGKRWREILRWASSPMELEQALNEEVDSTQYLLSIRTLKNLVKTGFANELIPVSSVTMDGMIELSATLTRILKRGEEIES